MNELNQFHLLVILLYRSVSHKLCLTHKQLETHGCVLSTVAADDLVPKHQTININDADLILTKLGVFQKDL